MNQQDWEAMRSALESGESAVIENDGGTMRFTPAPEPGIALEAHEADLEGGSISRTRFFDAAVDRPATFPDTFPFVPSLPAMVMERYSPPAVTVCSFGMDADGRTALDAESCLAQASALAEHAASEGWTPLETGGPMDGWRFERGGTTRTIIAMTVIPRPVVVLTDQSSS